LRSFYADDGRVIPLVDVRPLVEGREASDVAAQIGEACRESGFFYATGHGVDPGLQRRLEDVHRAFFALPEAHKQEIRMERGGRAWRGYFPVGGELTSGKPDQKQGVYYGSEEPASDRVLHGANLFPEDVREIRPVVLDYLDEMTRLAHALMRGVALSLGLQADYFFDRYTREPLILFRAFHYPPLQEAQDDPLWSVGEHTDYGLLTILRQDDCGGLEVKTGGAWTPAPPVPDAFVCNIGDMLDRMTAGLYRSTPHRVRNVSGRERISFPFFFDPGLDTRVEPIDLDVKPPDDASDRWDGWSPHTFEGTYGDYLIGKISKVFPELGREQLP
jgi:isopenicillin N synthase-like dioxygenase